MRKLLITTHPVDSKAFANKLEREYRVDVIFRSDTQFLIKVPWFVSIVTVIGLLKSDNDVKSIEEYLQMGGLNKEKIKEKIQELKGRAEEKRQVIAQAQKIISFTQMDITMIDGAIVEFKKTLTEIS